MHVFLTLFVKLLPIYVLIAVGYLAGKKLQVNKDSVSRVLIYIVAPVVVFNGVYITPLSLKTFALPAIFFVVCSLIAVSAYVLNCSVKPASLRGILGFAAGTGNTGYFGLPVALALYGEHITGLVIICTFGFILYENTVGFFLAARGKHSPKESIVKLLKLPALYAFVLGVLVHLLKLQLGGVYRDFVPNFRGAYVLLGSLIIGLALSEFSRAHAQWNVLARSFSVRFIVWPAIISALILIDRHYFKIYSGNQDIYRVAFLMSIVPLAANTVAYATFLNAEPERAAFAVFSSTIFALVYIPLAVSFVGPHLIG
jgi:predicted permease